MAIPLDGPGGLFTRLGLIFGAMELLNAQRGAEAGAAFDAIVAEFDGDEALTDSLYSSLEAHRSAASSGLSALRTLAANTVVEMVRADFPQPDLSLRSALAELVRQMEAGSETVKRSAVSASVAADPGNVGNVELVASVKLAEGCCATQSLPEDVVAVVTADGQPGGGSLSGRERIAVRGQFAVSPLDWSWPAGSGASISLTAVDAADDARGGAGNWLSNGDFAEWESDSSSGPYTPAGWVVAEGTAGVDVDLDSSSGYDEATALLFVGDGSTNATVHQEFGAAIGSGSPVEVPPLTQLALCMRIRVPTAATGVLRAALVDGSGAVLVDEDGNPAAVSVDLSGVGSSYQAVTGTLRTPAVVPATVRFQLRLTTPLQAGRTAWVDEVALARMTPLYPHGPSFAAFSGDVDAAVGDRFVASIGNDDTSGFQAWFDRAFGMRQLRLILPSSTTPTIDDALITSSPSS